MALWPNFDIVKGLEELGPPRESGSPTRFLLSLLLNLNINVSKKILYLRNKAACFC